jgi:Domain of unknown function (DUF1707)
MTDRPIRASDQERESVVSVLRDAFADGRLTYDEFQDRMAAGYAARTWTELRELTSDLPVQPVLGAGLDRRPQGYGPEGPDPAHALPPAVRSRRARRDRPFDRLLPVLFVWILISAAAGSPDMAAALSFVFICVLAIRIAHGGRW